MNTHREVKTLTGKTIELEVNANDSILNVKQKIKDKIGINIEEQRLLNRSKQLKNNRCLSDYGIDGVYNKILHLVERIHRPGMQIFVKTVPGYTITLDVNSTDTIADLKKKFKIKKDVTGKI